VRVQLFVSCALLLASASAATVALSTASCATSASASSSSSAKAASSFISATVGSSWTYQVVPGPPEPQTVTITGRDDRGFYVDDAGGKVAPRSDGIYDGARFLLKDPVEVGTTWIAVPKGPKPGQPGPTETYTITAVDVDVTVPAGTFAGCAQVTATTPARDPETGQAVTLTLEWTWAPGVGIVQFKQSVRRGDESTPLQTATMSLLSYTAAPPL
jgi:hypothetical protein